MGRRPTVVAYIIHWRALDRLERTVASLRGSTDVDLDLVVVDNASGEDAVSWMRSHLDGIRVLEAHANLGYAGAANLGLADARDRDVDAVVLAAHDVLVEPPALRLLVDALAASAQHAIVGPAHWDPTFDHVESLGGRYEVWGGGPLVTPSDAPPPDRHGIIDATFISGALMVLRPSLVTEISGMDARLFAYWEDVELCMRARALGHRVGVVPEAHAAESGYGAMHRTHAYLIARNHLLVTRRHLGKRALLTAAVGVGARSARAWLGSCIPTRPAAQRATSRAFASGRWSGLRDGLADRGGPPPELDSIGRWNRPGRLPGLLSGTLEQPTTSTKGHNMGGTARSRLASALSPRVLRKAFPLFERLGVHVTPVHFYQPVPDTRTLGDDLWARRSELVGIDLRVEEQLALLEEMTALTADLTPLPRSSTGTEHRFHLDNGTFGEVDAEVLRYVIHRHRPRRIVEIGSGYSTMLAAQALLEVADRHGEVPGELVAVEPYPSAVLQRGYPGLSRLVTSLDLAAVGPPLVRELEAGDILFIDSTHVLHLASDVRTELLQLVPLVAPGVLVHVHDIFFPLEYPRRWVMENRWFWTEQYVLQAFLSGNRSFEVVWASHLMHVDHPDRLAAAVTSYDPQRSEPGSFWFRRVR